MVLSTSVQICVLEGGSGLLHKIIPDVLLSVLNGLNRLHTWQISCTAFCKTSNMIVCVPRPAYVLIVNNIGL